MFALLLSLSLFALSQSSLESAMDLACSAEFALAKSAFQSLIDEQTTDPDQLILNAKAYHSLGNLAALETQFVLAGHHHAMGKASHPTTLPPLALRHQAKEPCNNIGDIFWVSSFVKKTMFDELGEVIDLTSAPSHDGGDGGDDSLPASLSKKQLKEIINAHTSLGTQLEDSGLVELAMLHFQKAEVIQDTVDASDSTLKVRNSLMVPVAYDSVEDVAATRAKLESKVSELHAGAVVHKTVTLPSLNQLSMPGTFYLIYMGYNDASVMTKIRNSYVHMFPKIQSKLPSPPTPLTPPTPSNGQKKIKIGFVSAYFRQHSICKLFCPIITSLNPDKYETHVFSSTSRKDGYTTNLQSNVHKFHDMGGFLLHNRNAVTAAELDILIYLDIGMDSGTDTWAYSRLAPVQMVTWGHPSTTGFAHMDYFLSSDSFHDNQGNDFERYAEQLIVLDSLSYLFEYPNHIPATIQSEGAYPRSELGIKASDTVFLVPQSLQKFHPSFDTVLHGILSADDSYVLVVIYDASKPLWKERLSDRFLRVMGSAIHSRITFVPSVAPNDFFRIISMSDILLDPYPFGGGVTTLEAFSLCKPVVTLPSAQSVPMLTKGMLDDVASELIASTEEEYVSTAVRLATDRKVRESLEKTICEKTRGKVYDNHAVVGEFEAMIARLLN
jgi:predicted O-linked N-acetylglucosamine transferase (SPINDLY family)